MLRKEHVIVYREADRWAGVPANYGIWSWGDDIVLRADAGTPDIGYPRAVQRTDGTIVSVYWWADSPGGERYVAATLWKP